MPQVDTVLFDLDGTLLLIDINEFLKRYFGLLTQEFSDLAEPDKLISSLYQATEKMIKNDGKKTNQEVFMDSFFSLIKVNNREQIMERFDQFYRKTYPVLQKGIEKNNDAVALVELFKEKNLQLVIATNPLFPLQAIVERIKWAGLNVKDFTYITSYEDMHFSKPNLNYYREILQKIFRKPQRCIMIGNDVQEDVIAQKIGIKTYLVDDFKIEAENSEIRADWEGSMAELKQYFYKKYS